MNLIFKKKNLLWAPTQRHWEDVSHCIMGLNGRREKLILRAVTVMWSAGTGGEVRRAGHLFWCVLQRSCPTFAWAATELPCHRAPSWKCPGTCCWRLREPATYASGKKSQEKNALFITKSPNTYSDLIWPLTVLLGEVWEKTHLRCPEAGDCRGSPLNLLSQIPGAIRTGLWNTPWPLCSRGKLGSLPADQGCTGCWRVAAGHKQAAVPWATKHKPGRGWQPQLWGFRSPEDKEQAALAVPMRQTDSINRAPANHWGMCLAPCVAESLSLSSCFSSPSSSHSAGVHLSVTAIPPECPLLFPDL